MDTVQITRILIAFTILVNFGDLSKVIKNEGQMIAKHCALLHKDPNFDPKEVTGTWKIYYTWKVSFSIGSCVEMTFKNATPELVKRIYQDINDYLEQQPNWDAATLHVSTGNKNHEVLLIPDQYGGPNGSFLGILNVIREQKLIPSSQVLPIIKFFIKLLNEGRFLLMIDCNLGAVASLSARHKPLNKDELMAVVNSLPLGTGNFTCGLS